MLRLLWTTPTTGTTTICDLARRVRIALRLADKAEKAGYTGHALELRAWAERLELGIEPNELADLERWGFCIPPYNGSKGVRRGNCPEGKDTREQVSAL